METLTPAVTEEPLPVKPKRKGLGALGWLSIGWIGGLLLLAILAPMLPIPDPGTSFPEIARKGPTAGHLLGGDTGGRDVLSRIIYGTRASFAVGFGAVAFGILIGGGLGMITGYFRGLTDSIITPLMTVLLAIPQFILALSLVTVLASADGTTTTRRILFVMFGLGVVSIPLIGRIARASTMAWAEREFVLAAKAMGATNWRVLIREVLPNIVPALLSLGLLAVGIAIVAEGGLSLFGAGVQLPTPSWGNIIAENRSRLRNAPHPVLFTSIFLFITVLALNYLGDLVRRRFDIRDSVL